MDKILCGERFSPVIQVLVKQTQKMGVRLQMGLVPRGTSSPIDTRLCLFPLVENSKTKENRVAEPKQSCMLSSWRDFFSDVI